MRIRGRIFAILLIAVNFLIVYYSWKLIVLENVTNSTWFQRGLTDSMDLRQEQQHSMAETGALQSPYKEPKNVAKSLTIVFRAFYDFENDLRDSIDSLVVLFPRIRILIISDETPYPPIYSSLPSNNASTNLTKSQPANVKIVTLNYDHLARTKDHKDFILDSIKTEFILFMPDSIRIRRQAFLVRLLKYAYRTESQRVSNEHKASEHLKWFAVIPVNVSRNLGSTLNNCMDLELDDPQWTLTLTSIKTISNNCDMFSQKHGILIKTDFMRDMPAPFESPFSEFFYIQSKWLNYQRYIYNETLAVGNKLFETVLSKKLRNERLNEQLRRMYKTLKIKRVIRNTYKLDVRQKLSGKDSLSPNNIQAGDAVIKIQTINRQIATRQSSYHLHKTVQYYGCERHTKSCLGQVVDQKPFYTYLGRHLPPCCRSKLVAVFVHVVEQFQNLGIRYWLENSALREAIEANQLAPDSYEIDIGFNAYDFNRSDALRNEPFVDEQGFHWSRVAGAREGSYYRVQYSAANEIGVNLLPYEFDLMFAQPKHFTGPKSKTFSVDFLHPMSTVQFLNRTIPCPNNVREFLAINNN